MPKGHYGAIPNDVKEKPEKPYPDFPLYAHRSGYWAAKIKGKTYYFGMWADPEAALQNYLERKPKILAGEDGRPEINRVTVKELVNEFLNTKKDRVKSGELTLVAWNDYKTVGDLIVAQFGKHKIVSELGPVDFYDLRKKMVAKKWGPHKLAKSIVCAKSFFKFAFDLGLIDKPVRYGPDFKGPSKKDMRLHRNSKGPRMFEADELRKIIGAAKQPLRAMILLGINCGFGNADCGKLLLSAVNLETGWIEFPRPKTGVKRRCPIWPETVAAIKDWLDKRPKPKDESNAGLVFITMHGQSWAKETSDTPISNEMRKLLKALGIDGNRNFYALRHTFETIGGESKDQVAVDSIMGHARDDMASLYRERISDERLQAVVNVVRDWLFAE